MKVNGKQINIAGTHKFDPEIERAIPESQIDADRKATIEWLKKHQKVTADHYGNWVRNGKIVKVVYLPKDEVANAAG